jgi:hypothetical protein
MAGQHYQRKNAIAPMNATKSYYTEVSDQDAEHRLLICSLEKQVTTPIKINISSN